MLVITGTQRCGTSVIAECLSKSGYDIGSSLQDEAGMGENEIISAFYRDYLGDKTFPFDDFDLPVLKGAAWEHFAELDLQVCKFSYLLMNPVFVMIWNKFRAGRADQDTFLIMTRNKTDVVASKRRMQARFDHDSILLDQTEVQLRANYLQACNLLCRTTDRFASLPFPACLLSFHLVNETLALLDPSVQITDEVWYNTIDMCKVHIKPAGRSSSPPFAVGVRRATIEEEGVK